MRLRVAFSGLHIESLNRNGEQIDHIQNRRDNQHRDDRELARIRRAEHQEEFRPGAGHGRQADNRHGAEEKRAERKRHHPAHAAQFRHQRLVKRHIDRAGAHEERHLAERMGGNLHRPAHYPHLRRQHGAESDVRKLRHGRIGEPRLQIVLMHGDGGSKQDRARRNPHEGRARPGLRHEVDPENVDRHFQYGENARLHDRHRVQEGRHRRRRDHGVRQPGMRRHQRRLADAENIKPHQHPGDRRDGVGMSGQNSADRKIGGAGDGVGPCDRRQQQADGGGHQHAEINASAKPRLFIPVMGDERESRQRQHFIENEEREQVRRESDPHGGGNRHCEAHEKACLMRFAVPAHIADGIDRIDDPQPARNHREHGAERLCFKCERQAADHVEQFDRRARAAGHRRKDLDRKREQHAARDQRRRLAQIRLFIEKPDGDKADIRQAKRQKNRQFCRHHGAPPAMDINASAARWAISPVRSVRTPK